jgi:hypothetical protein
MSFVVFDTGEQFVFFPLVIAEFNEYENYKWSQHNDTFFSIIHPARMRQMLAAWLPEFPVPFLCRQSGLR